jgi:hypothetical protein
MSTRRTTAEQIKATQEEIKLKEIRIQTLLKRQKAQDRKDRVRRFCERGGIVEKLFPDLAKLTPEQFDVFVQKTLLTGYAGKVLKGLVPPDEKQDEAKTEAVVSEESASIPAQSEQGGEESITPKPTQSAQDSGATAADRVPEVIRQGA